MIFQSNMEANTWIVYVQSGQWRKAGVFKMEAMGRLPSWFQILQSVFILNLSYKMLDVYICSKVKQCLTESEQSHNASNNKLP